ncbi:MULTISPECIES: 3-isopropylmalate dehydratase small subunit [unclassified Cupriavidus]|uniref:3-isopropylmalate dehydratase small subunit n=1 Tax=unclassified Cupriavidus TaxID=2640874 RepID=UPI001056A099|nr:MULTISPECIES: 3-isopropylmalate dehydratase small subunit [unclassified Cupriavidus]MBF6989055.1 3-isopropylmalate dehydratase small subunit [Cupriavidus sp. IK-TO18]TDF59454.1 3-isopropylmalate dehydratase small subunit [Cupriavidus sp. L7L]
MQPFTCLEAVVVPLDQPNVDTDAIIPKQFMKALSRTGFGDNLFDEWRYLDRGMLGQDASKRPKNPDFPLNRPCYAEAQIILARDNFGCGSSREHATWALHDYGIRALIAPSFADIFYANCFKNGILPIVLPADVIDALFTLVGESPGTKFHVDLQAQIVTPHRGKAISFELGASRKQRLLHGLDDIALTLQSAESIRSYEARRRSNEPWLFN